MAGARQPPELISAMLEPGFYPDQPKAVELRETHISWVLLVEDLAYKVKKPVVLPFLDFGTLERRHEMCREEVRLNRRLAPRIYRRVVAIVRRDHGYALAPEGAADAIEYAVEMWRVEENRSLASLGRKGELEAAQVDAVARLLARFHAQATPAPGGDAIATLSDALEENLSTLRELAGAGIDGARLDAAEHYTRRFLATHGEQLAARGRAGLIRECHGDLRAEHVVVPRRGDPYIYDCVEFSRGLREIDVAADLAFLVMDLARLGAEDLADRLVSEYRTAGGEAGNDRMIAFFASYRAWVRAKVACVRVAELAEGEPERARAQADARDLFALGERFAWRSRHPLLVVICGVAGSGKTTLAGELAARSGLIHISSDVVRKRLAGIEPTQTAAERYYSSEFTDCTYHEMGRAARAALEEDAGAILDATFHLRSERQAFRCGLSDPRTPVLFVECHAPKDVLMERVRSRARAATSTSDADEPVVKQQLLVWEPLDEVAVSRRIEISSEDSIEEQVHRVETFVDEPASDGTTR